MSDLPPDSLSQQNGVVLTAIEAKRRRTRSKAIGLVLGALVLLFYVVTMAKLSSNALSRPL